MSYIEWLDNKDTYLDMFDDRSTMLSRAIDECIIMRKSAYVKLNQDELRYDDMVNNTNAWGEAIEAIKAKYPKPVVE
jgi:hypothetical protein